MRPSYLPYEPTPPRRLVSAANQARALVVVGSQEEAGGALGLLARCSYHALRQQPTPTPLVRGSTETAPYPTVSFNFLTVQNSVVTGYVGACGLVSGSGALLYFPPSPALPSCLT